MSDSCSLQGRVSRLEQRNLLQFARVPTKLSGGFSAAFFFPGFQKLATGTLVDVPAIHILNRVEVYPCASTNALFLTKSCMDAFPLV